MHMQGHPRCNPALCGSSMFAQVFSPEEFVYRAGEPATALYFVHKGMAVLAGSAGLGRIFGPRSYFGEVRVLAPNVSCSVTSVSLLFGALP